MKQRPDLKPYYHSQDWNVNASLTFKKLHRRIREQNPSYVPMSRFQKRHRSARAAYLGKRTCS